jgi:hypothetical protein
MVKKTIFVAVILIWLLAAIAIFALYLLREVSPVKEFISWALGVWPIIAVIGTIALGISALIIKWGFKTKEALSLIKAELQIQPIDIDDDSPDAIYMAVDVLNHSNYMAKNITIDIKVGDNQWKNQLNIASVVSNITEPALKERLKNIFKYLSLNELGAWKKTRVHIGDLNKDWLLKEKTFSAIWVDGQLKITNAIDTKATKEYQISQGWKEQIEKAQNHEPIKILFHVTWEDKTGKKDDRIFEYELACTKVETGTSYVFLPK